MNSRSTTASIFAPLGRTWQFESATGPVSFDVRPKLSANDQFVLTAAALRGNGIALLPSYAVASALRAGTLVRVLHRFSVPRIWINCHGAGGPRRRAARAVVGRLPEGSVRPRAAMGPGKLTVP